LNTAVLENPKVKEKEKKANKKVMVAIDLAEEEAKVA
jgi:hypothetical protein